MKQRYNDKYQTVRTQVSIFQMYNIFSDREYKIHTFTVFIFFSIIINLLTNIGGKYAKCNFFVLTTFKLEF